MNPSSEREAVSPTGNVLAQSRVFHLDQMPVRKMANGGRSWDVVRGVLATGEAIAIHESEQPAGLAPNPAHTIEHTEFITIIEGTVEFVYDGKTEPVGSGGVLYVARGTMHQVKNIGDGPARYVVVSIGGDVKR